MMVVCHKKSCGVTKLLAAVRKIMASCIVIQIGHILLLNGFIIVIYSEEDKVSDQPIISVKFKVVKRCWNKLQKLKDALLEQMFTKDNKK